MTLPEPPKFPQLPKLPEFPFQPPVPIPRPPAVGVPGLAAGVVVAPKKGWCKADFYDALTGNPMTFSSPPAVVALAEIRMGDIKDVAAPTITMPKIELPKLPKIEIPFPEIPQLQLSAYVCKREIGWWIFTTTCNWVKIALNPDYIPDWLEPYIPDELKPPTECPEHHGAEYIEKVNLEIRVSGVPFPVPRPDRWASIMKRSSLYWAQKLAPDWGVLNWIRNEIIEWVSWMFCAPGAAIGYTISKVGAGILAVQAAIDTAITDLTKEVADRVNDALSDSRDKVQGGMDSFRTRIQLGVNEGLGRVIPTVYSMMGLAEGMLMSPISTRNVTTKNFEFYSLSEGMKVHYVGAGPA